MYYLMLKWTEITIVYFLLMLEASKYGSLVGKLYDA